MSNTEEVVTICDWCLQEARVQTIDENLWRFWKVISVEDPIMASHKNICDKCKSRYEGFSIYIERCKINKSKIDELLSMGQIKDEPSIDIEYHPLIKKEISDQADWNSCRPAVSTGVFIEQQMLAGCSNFPMKSDDSTIDEVLSAGDVKKEPLIDIEDHLINEEEASGSDYPTACDWCLKEIAVQKIEEKLWHFWGIISDENPLMESLRNICEKCKSLHEGFSIYIESCKRNESTVETILSSEGIKEEPSIDIEYHHLIKEEEVSDTTSGGRGQTGWDLQERHRVCPGSSDIRVEPKTAHMCSYCEKQFSFVSNLRRHMRSHTGEKPFTCSSCDKSFSSYSRLKGHSRIHTGDPFKCTSCDKRFPTAYRLKLHSYIHTGDKPFTCSSCDKSFLRSSDLKTHSRIHTGDKPFTCSSCDNRFPTIHQLKSHSYMHTGDKPFTCLSCDKRFSFSSHLKIHSLIHTGEKPFTCTSCDKRFPTAYRLKLHSYVHTGDKPFTCSSCDKRFSFSSHLKRHSRIHTGDKPFTCSSCDKRFPTIYQLKLHSYMHTGVKPFTCLSCDKGFFISSNLKIHSRIHTGDKPFTCSSCDKRFSSSAHLKRHSRIHTGK